MKAARAAALPLAGHCPGSYQAPAPASWPLGSAGVGPLALVRLLLATALLLARAFGHDVSRSMGMRRPRRGAPQGVRGRGSARRRDGSRTRTGRPGAQPAWACHRSKRRARSLFHQTLPPHRPQPAQTSRIRGLRPCGCRNPASMGSRSCIIPAACNRRARKLRPSCEPPARCRRSWTASRWPGRKRSLL